MKKIVSDMSCYVFRSVSFQMPTPIVCMYVCMYLMIGKGQIAQKRPYWGEIDLRAKFMGKYNCLVVF